MPLDPQTQLLLDRMKAAGRPPLHTYSPAEARALYEQTSPILDAPNVPIGASEDRDIPAPHGGTLKIRIYTPTDAPEGPLPCLVYFHGGGFVLGSIQTHDTSTRLFTNAAGIRVISVDYRLSPETKFPGPVEDCLAATQWVHDHAAEIGVDPNRMAVGGDSAGGNLAGVICQILKSSEGSPRIRYQLLIYPVTDTGIQTGSRMKFVEGYFLEKKTMDWFHQLYTRGEQDWMDHRCSPLRFHDFSGLPAAYIITAGYDPLRDEGRLYADKLQAAGVPVTYKDYPGQIHGFWNMTGVIDEARTAIEDAAHAVRDALTAD